MSKTSDFLGMTLYLSHPYTDDPEQSIENAIDWVYTLRNKGFVIFSPILHTHFFHVAHKAMSVYPPHTADKILNEQMKYVEWDLDMLKALMAGDGDQWQCNQCYGFIRKPRSKSYCPNCNRGEPAPIEVLSFIPHDSKLCMLLDEAAFDFQYIVTHKTIPYRMASLKKPEIDKDEILEIKKIWYSDGCRREYEFCKANFIGVYSLQAWFRGEVVGL